MTGRVDSVSSAHLHSTIFERQAISRGNAKLDVQAAHMELNLQPVARKCPPTS